MKDIAGKFNKLRLEIFSTKIEREVYDCKTTYVLTFSGEHQKNGESLSGTFGTTDSGVTVGVIKVKFEKHGKIISHEYFYENEKLITFLSYYGNEPSWIELNKLGVPRQRIRRVKRVTCFNDNREILENFNALYRSITNNN